MSTIEPSIRFDVSSKPWTRKKISEVSSFSKGSGYCKDDLVDNGTPIVLYGRLYTKYETVISNIDTFVNEKSGSVKSKGGEVVVPATGESELDIARASVISEKDVIIGGDLNILSPTEEVRPVFLALSLTYGISHYTLAKRAQGISIIHIHNSDIQDLEINYPDVSEQDKICNFFEVLDEKIRLHELNVSNLKNMIKGLTQKLFTDKLRFKNTDGRPFPDWTECKVGDLLTEYHEKSKKGGDIEHVSLTKDGVVPKTDRYNRDFLVKNDEKNYRVTHLNDICYNPANLKFGVICRNKYGTAIFSPIYITFKVKEGISPIFVEYLLTRNDFIKYALRYEQGTVYERMAVSPSDLCGIKVKVPCKAEQDRIAKLLTAFEERINAELKEIDQLKNLKTGFLQKMFINN